MVTPRCRAQVTTPVVVQGVANISASKRQPPVHFTILFSNGSVRAWGRNENQLAEQLAILTDVVQVASGTSTIVRFSNGSLGLYGLSAGSPLRVPDDSYWNGARVVDMVYAEGWMMVLLSDGSVRCWGRMRRVLLPPQLGVPSSPSPLYDSAVALADWAAGPFHMVAVSADQRRVLVWAADMPAAELPLPQPLAAIGNSSNTTTNDIAGDVTVRGVAAGLNFTLVLLGPSGRVVGYGDIPDAGVPRVARDVTAIAAGWRFAVAVREDGHVILWGDPVVTQNCSLIPIPPAVNKADSPVRSVTAGMQHAVVLLEDGSVRSWGCNESGQLPPENLTATIGRRALAVAAGQQHTLVLLQDGRVMCFGLNDEDQCDANALGGISDALAIAAGPLQSAVYSRSSGVLYFGVGLDDVPRESPGFGAKAVLTLPPGTHAATLRMSRHAAVMLIAPGPPPGGSGLEEGDLVNTSSPTLSSGVFDSHVSAQGVGINSC